MVMATANTSLGILFEAHSRTSGLSQRVLPAPRISEDVFMCSVDLDSPKSMRSGVFRPLTRIFAWRDVKMEKKGETKISYRLDVSVNYSLGMEICDTTNPPVNLQIHLVYVVNRIAETYQEEAICIGFPSEEFRQSAFFCPS